MDPGVFRAPLSQLGPLKLNRLEHLDTDLPLVAIRCSRSIKAMVVSSATMLPQRFTISCAGLPGRILRGGGASRDTNVILLSKALFRAEIGDIGGVDRD